MQSIHSIALIVLFLFKGLVPGMDFSCELQKLPNLLEHYETHKQSHDDSFWTFLVDHYLENDIDHNHPDEEHDNLPLHGNHHCCYVAVFYPEEHHFDLIAPYFTLQSRLVSYTSTFTSQFLDALFQPPRH